MLSTKFWRIVDTITGRDPLQAFGRGLAVGILTLSLAQLWLT